MSQRDLPNSQSVQPTGETSATMDFLDSFCYMQLHTVYMCCILHLCQVDFTVSGNDVNVSLSLQPKASDGAVDVDYDGTPVRSGASFTTQIVLQTDSISKVVKGNSLQIESV